MSYPLIFERSKPGRGSNPAALSGVPLQKELPSALRRKEAAELPQVSEVELVRHYTGLSRRNFGVDLGFYPLGSCTMKYNPKINEDTASLPDFTNIHPHQPQTTVQGTLELMHSLLEILCEITGMDWGTLQPFAGAHGEYTGMKFFRSYFDERGETQRTKVIVPDSSHGTNPASAHIAGFDVVEIPSGPDGLVDMEALKAHCDDTLAGIMLTNPNTLGLFETHIVDIAEAVHKAGGLLYYDGANLNAIMGKCRPGDMGFDVVHLNLHKTFSTPHGGGGPGAGPVLIKERLRPYLPTPDITKTENGYRLEGPGKESLSMGRIAGFYGNIGVLIRAYTYISTMGPTGLEKASEYAVLNANYIRSKLEKILYLRYPGICKHEFVLSAKNIKEKYGITAIDIAKGLIENGIHPPTVYFPLIVPEALMIEPTETETKETLDHFCTVMEQIVSEGKSNPQKLHTAPQSTPVSRVDEVLAARKPIVCWTQTEE